MNIYRAPLWPLPLGWAAVIVGLLMQVGTLPSAGLVLAILGAALIHAGLMRRDRTKAEEWRLAHEYAEFERQT